MNEERLDPFKMSSRPPTKMKLGTWRALGDGFVLHRGSKCWRLTHPEMTVGSFIWERREWQNEMQRWLVKNGCATRGPKYKYRYDVYDGAGKLESTGSFREALEYVKAQIRAVTAAKRLGAGQG